MIIVSHLFLNDEMKFACKVVCHLICLNFPLTCLVTGGLTLFHQTGVVRAIPARSCCVGGGGGADGEHASDMGHKYLAYSDSSLSKFFWTIYCVSEAAPLRRLSG